MNSQVKAHMENAIQKMLSTDLSRQQHGAYDILQHASSSHSARELLVQDARVIKRLVELLRQGTVQCLQHVQLLLSYLAEVGAVVEVQIANALDAAALKVLDDYQLKNLLDILLKNPKAEALLAAKRGKPQVLTVLKGAPTPTNMARWDSMIDVLSSVIVEPTFFAGGISHEEAQEVLFQFRSQLSDRIHLDDTRQAVLRSLTTSISEHIRAAANAGADQQTATARRYAVLWLANTIRADDAKRQEIMIGGGVASLVAELRREMLRTDAKSDDQKRSSSEMKRQIVAAVAIVVTEVNMRKDIIGRGGLNSLTAFCNASKGDDTMLGVQVLELFMVDDDIHNMISDAGGVPLLVRHLRFGSSDKLKIETIRVLTANYLFTELSDTEASKKAMASFDNCKGPAGLYKLCKHSVAPDLRSAAERLLKNLTSLIPSLLQLSDAESLGALELMSTAQKNCKAIVQSGGIDRLAELAIGKQADVRAAAMRVLANLACNNDTNRALMTGEHLLEELVSTFENQTDGILLDAAATLLRNLPHNESMQTKIGRSGVIPRLIDLVGSSTSLRIREVAAAILGNLGRKNHRVNQMIITHFGGATALVEFARTATTKRQRQSVTMALWVLVKDNEECREQFLAADGFQAIERIHKLNEAESQPWATRILAAAQPLVNCRS